MAIRAPDGANKICKYNLNLRRNKLDNNVMILSAKFADIKVSNFLIETRLDACEYSNETIFLKRKLYWFWSQRHCFDAHVLSLIFCLAAGREHTWSVHRTGQLKKLIISFETKRTYKVTTAFVFESNEESFSKIWFSSSKNFMLWFVCFIIPQVLIDCPILKRLVLISCVSSVSDLTNKCKQFRGTTCNTINVLTWMFFLQFVILFTTDYFNTASIWNPSKTTWRTPSAENHFVKKNS